MKAGTYFVGDLCYVLHDAWDEVCLVTSGARDGLFTLNDGRTFAMYSTTYGDGTYPSNSNGVFSVDSGTIGCILKSDIRDNTYPEDVLLSLGNFIEFPEDFETSSENGTICIGHVLIETDGCDDDFLREDEDY